MVTPDHPLIQLLKLIDMVTDSIINKIVKIPTLQLKQVCQRDRADELSKTLNELFNLEFSNNSKPKAK